MFTINKSRSSNIAGVALHKDLMCYVELDGGRGSLKVVRQETVPIAPGAIVKNSLTDVDAVAGAFKNLKSAVGGFKCPVVLGIPSRDITLRLLEYPIMSASAVKDTLALDFDKYFPYP